MTEKLTEGDTSHTTTDEKTIPPDCLDGPIFSITPSTTSSNNGGGGTGMAAPPLVAQPGKDPYTSFPSC